MSGRAPDRADLLGITSELYADAPFLTSMRQRLRLHVCPYEVLVSRVPQDASVLDVGCGAGLFLLLLARLRGVTSAVGFDHDRLAISAARQAAGHINRVSGIGGVSLRFEHRSIRDPWPPGLFDVVSIIDVMHHVPSSLRGGVLEQMRTHVRPGGLLLYKDMCRLPRWRAFANQVHDLVFARQWIAHEPIERIDEWAAKWGAVAQCAVTIQQLWYGHEVRIFEAPVS